MNSSDKHDPPNTRDETRKSSAIERFFFLSPTLGILLALLLLTGGLTAYFVLVKESLPDLAIPQATISTNWPGADPQTIEQEVTEPIEKEIKSLKGVKTLTSASFDSYSIIAVEFEAAADLRESMMLLRSRVNDAEAELPVEAEKPRIDQVSVDDRPILSIALYGEVDKAVLSRVAEDLQDRLERLQGVNEVELGGLREEVIQILLEPERLLSLGISPTKIRDAVQSANLDMPWGAIENEKIGARLRLAGRFHDASDLSALPVARLGDNNEGRLIRLGEVGIVRRELESETKRAYFSWKGSPFQPSIEISVKKTPGADTLEVIDAVERTIEKASSSTHWPSTLNYRITQDESEQISDSLSDVLMNGLQAMAAVFVILLLMLSWREGLIAGLAIPLTFCGALVIVWMLGYTLNQLVIIGMVLALGLLVDVFILMMEGLHEAIFVEKLSFSQAALKTVRRYSLPAAAGQITTILALAPLMAISGVAGKFIRVLPVTAIACLVVAFFVALLVAVPVSRFLLERLAQKKGYSPETKADQITVKLTGKLQAWSLQNTLRNRRTAGLWTAGAVTAFVLSLVAFSQVPIIMYPKSDGLKLGITIELPPSATLEKSQHVADRVGRVLREKPYLESVVKLVGEKSPMAQRSLADALIPSTGENFIGFSSVFVPREEREKPAYEYADELREEITSILEENYAAAKLVVVAETGQPESGEPVQIVLTGDDMDELQEISASVQESLSKIKGATDVRDNIGSMQAEIALVPDREAIDFYGLTQRDLAAQIRYAMSSDTIGKFAVSGVKDDLDIKLGMTWPSRKGKSGGPTKLDELSLVRAFTPGGGSISLLSLLRPYQDMAPVSVTHKDARRAITVMGKSKDRAVTEIMGEFTAVVDEMQNGWPAGYQYSIGGEAEQTAESFGSAGVMLVIAVILVFSVLVLIFGSFAQSLILITTIPLAMLGTFAGFALFGIPFSFFAMVGIIALLGIVINDGIVMVDTMNVHLRKGMAVAEAAAHGASDRLRPIVSTSLTTIVGLIPLAISNPMWRPLCYAVIFGLIASTILSLVIIPCLYLLLTGSRRIKEQVI